MDLYHYILFFRFKNLFKRVFDPGFLYFQKVFSYEQYSFRLPIRVQFFKK